ncbi:MAG: hypothetical protein KAS72_05965 [Phycisphaerales bacterium]|nr:hypothetical protein [Phycisphaerales bacterium]
MNNRQYHTETARLMRGHVVAALRRACVSAVGGGAVLLVVSATSAEVPIASVLLREHANVTPTVLWESFSRLVVSPDGRPAVTGRTTEDPVIWLDGDVVIGGAPMSVIGHPDEPGGDPVYADLSSVKSFSINALGEIGFVGRLECEGCSFDQREAVLVWSGGDECIFHFGAGEEIWTGYELLSWAGITCVRLDDASVPHAFAFISLPCIGGRGLFVATEDAVPFNAQPVIYEGDPVQSLEGIGSFECVERSGPSGILRETGEVYFIGRVASVPSGEQHKVFLDDQVILSAGEQIGGRVISDIELVALSSGSELMIGGELTGDVPTGFIAYGGVIVAEEGNNCTQLAGATYIDEPEFVAVDESGNAAYGWTVLTDDEQERDVLIYNGELILQAGDLLDANNDGVIDGDDYGAMFESFEYGHLKIVDQTAYVIGTALLPQYGYRQVLLRIAPLPDVSNPWATQCIGDLNGDDDTDQNDLGILLAAYSISAGGDLDGDDDTDQSDLAILLADFGCAG